MPSVRPISDLQRNLGDVADECHRTQRPVYLTKNGSASLVVMDAAAFDEQAEALAGLRDHVQAVQRAIARGYDDYLHGRTRPWEQARTDADAIRALRDAS